ncbi:NAD(P)-dependent oxidoreductase [Chryseobacterium shigense]|uniref:Putative NADH-flavin reductase n=1 Tax=Chryseobacterium shigense TaxID=297244 RepID=A0A841NG30_9FLAO|nr:NAD(P)H-binding protein [Chryseobacterium shigense]MBB6369825.1 putative NADH-flavin reductase [Chryseobacterium shigense]
MKTHKIAIIGGTGKSGNYLVQELLKREYSIKLLLRTPENFTTESPLIEIVQGDARDFEAVDRLVKDCSAVISKIGQPVGEEPIFRDATKNIIQSMNFHGIKRYITITGLNVNTPFDHKNNKVKAATDWMYQNYPKTTKNKQEEYEILVNSNLDWTLVRLPLIIPTSEHFTTETNLEDCLGEKISAADLSEFLVSQIDNETYIRKSPFLYNV